MKKCPHCGQVDAVKPSTGRKIFGQDCNSYLAQMHAVICDCSMGGCGATSGFHPNEADALYLWDRRADVGEGERERNEKTKRYLEDLYRDPKFRFLRDARKRALSR